MVVIRLNYQYLEQLVGVDHETIVRRLPMIGCDVDRVEEDHVDVEFFPDRPDLFSTEGVAHALRGFLGIEHGITTYHVKPSPITFSVDPHLAPIRPYLGSAVIRHVKLKDEAAIESMMGLQEALHWAIGRGRGKVAIGIHDLDRVKPPFRYIAAPRTRAFVPLDFTSEMTMEEILEKHPKGRDYAHIVNHFPLFPLIVDANDDVLSFPPIINGELTRVASTTTNVLLDTTGTDLKAVTTTVRIICAAFAETGARIERVTIDGTPWPDLAPRERLVSVRQCSQLLGIDLSPQRMAELLEAMRFGAVPVGPDQVRVEIPCYRADIMHDWDVFEDVAIAHGYENFSYELPPVSTIGEKHPITAATAVVRNVFVGLGYIEMMPFTLSNEHVMYDMMQRPRSRAMLRVMHPISEEHTVVRTDILPILIEILQLNRHRELPQRIFAVGDVVNGTSTFQKVAAASIHQGADFSEAYACLDALCHELAVEYEVKESSDPAFFEGRRGDVYVGGLWCGVFGEVHPAVLNAFDLEQPIAALELDLRAVPGFLGQRGTPSPG